MRPETGTPDERNHPDGRYETRHSLILDCDRCDARNIGCGDCVVAALIGPPSDSRLDAEDRRVFAVLHDAGLVPPLRLAPGA